MKKTWLTDVFGNEKVAIGVVHLKALPSDPLYDEKKGIEGIFEIALHDVLALQGGGIDGLIFSNEFSFPYQTKVSMEIIATMAYIIGRLKPYITVPYGANVISDVDASISLNAAIGGQFMRGLFAGTFSGNLGLTDLEPGGFIRHRHNLGLDDKLKMVHYIVPESSKEIGGRDSIDIAKSAKFMNLPDAFGIVGEQAGKKIDMELMRRCRELWPEMVLFATTGVNIDSIEEIYKYADAAFIATHFKKDGIFENEIDEERVRRFMNVLKEYRNKG